MSLHSTSTDNANVSDKVRLRRLATQGLDELRVLDLFAGKNVLWSKFDCTRYYGIEMQKGKGKNLYADNLKVIPSLDLSGFNVIDCDSYGIPFSQIMALYDNKTLKNGTCIIYTCISNKISGMNKQALEMFGLRKIYKKNKVMLAGYSIDYFFEMLRRKGVKTVTEYSVNGAFKKHYGFFFVDK